MDATEFQASHSKWPAWLVLGSVAACVLVLALIVRAGLRDGEKRAVAQARSDYQFQLRLAQISGAGAAGLRRISKGRQESLNEALRKADAAETVFMESCRKCAAAAECERDRLVIAAGRATDSYNPCD